MEPKLFGDLEPEQKINLNKHFLQSVGGCLDDEKLICSPIRIVLLLINSLMWPYIAGAGAEIMDTVGAGAKNK